jgi:hypothetical protein
VPVGRYGSIGFWYPEAKDWPGYPTPGGGFHFHPVAVCDQEIVYIGDIDMLQGYSLLGAIFNSADVEWEVYDRYEETVALFRERYPGLRDRPVARRVLRRSPFEEGKRLDAADLECPAADSDEGPGEMGSAVSDDGERKDPRSDEAEVTR